MKLRKSLVKPVTLCHGTSVRPIWSLPVRPEQPDGLFGDGNPGRGKATSNQVVGGMVSWSHILLVS